MTVAVIIAGGRGERFWPRSRRRRPKQFLEIAGEGTMLQGVVRRILPAVEHKDIYVVVPGDLAGLVREQLPDVPPGNVLTEPVGRNTAAAIGLAGAVVRARTPGATMAVLPADHIIGDDVRFLEVLGAAVSSAVERGALVTLGVKPSRVETGYGHVKRGAVVRDILPEESGTGRPVHVYEAAEFTEKPDRETATRYTESGEYFWNAGMFVWTCDAIMEALREHMPQLASGMDRLAGRLGKPDEQEVIREVYEGLESVSIDYGVMEKAAGVLVVEADFPWEDLGSWAALGKLEEPDGSGNRTRGPFVGLDARDCIVESDGTLVAALGVRDLVIVASGGAVLVCPRDRAQEVKRIVEKLREEGDLERFA